MQRYTCVVCHEKQYGTLMHRFTRVASKQQVWIKAVRSTNEGRRNLTAVLSVHKNPFLCASHFAPSDFIQSSLRPDAVPFFHDLATSATVAPATVTTVPSFLPASPLNSPMPSSSRVVPPSSSSLVPYVRPPPLIDRSPPPCCVCCCRPEQEILLFEEEQSRDPNWTPDPATTGGSPLSEYLVVSTEALLPLLRQCTSCIGGERSLTVKMHGLAISCTGACNQCGAEFNWRSSKTLPTATASKREKLFKINVDVTTGAVLTSVGGTKLRQVLTLCGLPTLSPPTFHRLKKFYVIPGINEHFYETQAKVLEAVKEKIAKGGKIHICGDGSFDSRGYSAAWCRYFLLDAETGIALHYILMHKSETGSSGTMEVAALERGLNELSYMIGGLEGIESVVTDRHGAVTKMMRTKFPGIKHFFDPWHFFRNIVLTLISICKPAYMTPVRFWVKPIINRCYDAVITAQGNGELASEKFRAILLCMQGQHSFDKDPSFNHYKNCTHSTPKDPNIFISKGSKIITRLKQLVFTEKNVEDIKSVSWLLQTSPCESINALAWRYAPKDLYFIRSGHECRTKVAIIHWNFLKETALDGSRPVVGRKAYTNPTHKNKVYRKVRKAIAHPWRDEIKRLTIEIRQRMTESPLTTENKRKQAKAMEKKMWEARTRPAVPHPSDCNIEWSSDDEEDEDAILVPALSTPLQLCALADLEEYSDEEEQE